MNSKCIVRCQIGDNTCFGKCKREYDENLQNCPCQERCPLGCPCPNYQCPETTTGPITTTTTIATTTSTTATTQTTTTSTTVATTTADLKTWILVLNTRSSSNVPLIIDGRGSSKEIDFVYEENTMVNGICSIFWHGQMYLFGGYHNERQISLVDRCRLTRIGNLSFDMRYGACAQREDFEIFICFEHVDDTRTYKNCRLSTGPLENFSNLPNSTYDHGNTRIAVTSGKFD